MRLLETVPFFCFVFVFSFVCLLGFGCDQCMKYDEKIIAKFGGEVVFLGGRGFPYALTRRSGYLIQSLVDQAVIGKILILKDIVPCVTYLHICLFKYKQIFLDQLLLLYKVRGSSMRGILYYNVASREPLKASILSKYF